MQEGGSSDLFERGMVLGLRDVVRALLAGDVSEPSADDPQPSAETLDAFARQRISEVVDGGGGASSALFDEVRDSLEEFKTVSQMKSCAADLKEYLVRIRVEHTAAESTSIAMEALRTEGLKAIKKWRAWQAFKSEDRIQDLQAFLHAKPNFGSVTLDVPKLVPLDAPKSATLERANQQAERQLRRAAQEMRLEDADAIVARFLELRESDPDNLALLGAVTKFMMQVVVVEGRNMHERKEEAIKDFKSWLETQENQTRVAVAQARLKQVGRSAHSSLDLLRSTESQCSRCAAQTYLVEEHTRRSDEPSDWFRICPSCGFVLKKS